MEILELFAFALSFYGGFMTLIMPVPFFLWLLWQHRRSEGSPLSGDDAFKYGLVAAASAIYIPYLIFCHGIQKIRTSRLISTVNGE